MPVPLSILVVCLVLAAGAAASVSALVTREVQALARAQVRVGDLTEARTLLAASAGALRTRHAGRGGESGPQPTRR